MADIVLSPRLRPSPFVDGVETAGPRAYTVYNHMRLPLIYESLEADCAHLKTRVQVWDVAAERQVQLAGPDALRLLQWTTPRDLSKVRPGVCAYIPVCDETGGLLNDPVALCLAPDRWWLSLADSDILLWAKGLALGAGLDVAVDEPDVSPLAVQGPMAEDLVARLFGDGVRDIRPFHFRRLPFAGAAHVVARTGWSKQSGFEIFVEGSEHGPGLWDALMDRGQDLGVRPGAPNAIERVEAGLLSYGNDITREHTPYQAGMARFCHPDRVDCLGRETLLHEANHGPPRQIRCLTVAGDALAPPQRVWPVTAGDAPAGRVASAVWSPEFGTNIAVGMIERAHWQPGARLSVETPDGPRDAVVREKFFR